MTEISYSLQNAIIGKNVRIFNSKQDSFYSKINNDLNEYNSGLILINDQSLNYSYIMKDNQKIKLNIDLQDDFIQKMKGNLQENKNSVYYDKVLTSLSFINNNGNSQLKNNFYFYNSNKLFSSDQNLISGRYQLNHEDIRQMIEDYVSQRYDSSFYSQSLKLVNDMSIPIYDLNYSALNNIDILKFESSSIVNSILTKFNLEQIKDQILYNSKQDQKSTANYDSILISPIVNYLSQQKLTEFFEFVFQNLQYDSFYRLLIPVGKISSVYNDKTITSNSIKQIENYSYYINVDEIQNLSSNIKFNYFQLKNLQNPHDEYDYEVFNVNQNKSLHTDAYSLSGSSLYKIITFLQQTNKSLCNLIDSHHAAVISGQYIQQNDLLSTLVEQSSKTYTNWSDETLSSYIAKEGTWIRYKSFNNYFKTTYNKILKDQPYLIRLDEVYDFIDQQKQNYISTFQDEQLLSSFYPSGLVVYDQMKTNIQLYTATTNSKYGPSGFLRNHDVTKIQNSTLSETYKNLKSLFNPSLYKQFAINILNSNSMNDLNNAEENEQYLQKYPVRFSTKINDYKLSYDSLYEHQNIMKKDGHLFGYRSYNFLNKTFSDKIFLSYNYFTSYDTQFLNDNELIDDVQIIADDSDNIPTFSTQSTNVNSFRLNEQQICKLNNTQKIDQFNAYFQMLKDVRKYEFVDFVDGHFKYKQVDTSKSNVYSIQLKNTNLNYTTYNYDQMISICLLKNTSFSYDKETLKFKNNQNNTEYGFLDVVHQLGFKQILDITMNQNLQMLQKVGFTIPFSSYKFYNINDTLNQNIQLKMKTRVQLEKAIRKSINRYAPINTTLWKIKYSGI